MKVDKLTQLLNEDTHLKDWEGKIKDIKRTYEIRIDNNHYEVDPKTDYNRLETDFNIKSDKNFLMNWMEEIGITQEEIDDLDFDNENNNLEPHPDLIDIYTILFVDGSQSFIEFGNDSGDPLSYDVSDYESLAQTFNEESEYGGLNWDTDDLQELIKRRSEMRKTLPKEFKPLTKKIDLD